MKKVKVIIIGAGSGGLSARREVSKVTDDYLVIDGGTLGTTCARVGCMPSKVLIQVAEDFHRRHKFTQEGLVGAESISLDSKIVMEHVRILRDRFVRGVTQGMASWDKTKLIKGYAKFINNNTLSVNGLEYEAEKIIIATGTKPNIPEIFKGFESYLVTTDEFFELPELPSSMAVVGLGVIGIELGQALSRLGVDFLGIARRRNIAGVTDPVLNEYVTRKLSEEMNLSYKGIQSVKEYEGKLEIVSGDKKILVNKILVTTGRSHQLDKLGIENTSVEINQRGIPIFDEETFQVKGPNHIFLAGDITGTKQILHEASDEGRIAGFNCVHDPVAFQTRTPLGITFSDPNIAFTGLTFNQIEQQKISIEIGEVLFEGQGRSIVKLKEIGMLRVYGSKSDNRLIGAELFAPGGEHLAHLLSWVISQKLTVQEVLALPFYHPVVEEGLRTALRNLRDKLDPNNDVSGHLEIMKRE